MVHCRARSCVCLEYFTGLGHSFSLVARTFWRQFILFMLYTWNKSPGTRQWEQHTHRWHDFSFSHFWESANHLWLLILFLFIEIISGCFVSIRQPTPEPVRYCTSNFIFRIKGWNFSCFSVNWFPYKFSRLALSPNNGADLLNKKPNDCGTKRLVECGGDFTGWCTSGFSLHREAHVMSVCRFEKRQTNSE